MENYVNRQHSDKSIKFCIVVDHDLTNDFSHNSKVPKIAILGKIVQIMWKNREKWENISRIHICLCIGMKFCTVVVHILIKDISYDIRLNKSKTSQYWGKIFKFRALMCNCIKITPFFWSAVKSANAWPHTSSRPVWKLRIDQIIDMHGDFLSGVHCASEIGGWTPG